MKILTGASVEFTAFHTDPTNDPAINEGRHQHTWLVTAWVNGEPFTDARTLRGAISRVLDSLLIPGTDDLSVWSGEDIARHVATLNNVVEVNVDRPGFRVRLTR